MKPRWLIYGFLIVFLTYAVYYLYAEFYPAAETTAKVMDTSVRIKVSGRGAPAMARDSFSEIRRLEKLFNKYDSHSEIARLNRASSEESLEISVDTSKILAVSERMKKITNGAFDITLGGKDEFKNPVDLSGIAKGYAAEQVRRLLLKRGASQGIIDLHSTIAVFGGREWEIGIRHPRFKDQLLGTITLSDNQSLSTSGDYERGQHIIDPRTQKPAALCQAVTVVGTNAAETDALSTGIFVLGPVKGMDLAKQLGIKVLIVDNNGKIHENFGFKLR